METIILHDITRALIKINDDCVELVKSASELKRFKGRKVRLTDDKGVAFVGFYYKSEIKSSMFYPYEIYLLSHLQKVRKNGTASLKTIIVFNPTKMEILD